MSANQPTQSYVDREIARTWNFVQRLSARDSTGRRALYFLYVRPHRKSALMQALESDETIDLTAFGDVIASNYGDAPTAETRKLIKSRFEIDI